MKILISNICLGTILALTLIVLPSDTPSDSHDKGSQACLEYWISHKFEFGKDIIQNIGPYGSICYPSIYVGIGDLRKLILSITASLGLLWVTMKLFKNESFYIQLILTVCLVLFYNNEIRPYLTFIGGFYLLLVSCDYYDSLVVGLLFALHSLAKVNCLFLNILLLGLLIFTSLLIHNTNFRAKCLLAIITNIISFIFLWTFAGQNLRNIPNMILSAQSFCSGYYSMSVYEPIQCLVIGILSFCLPICIIIYGFQNTKCIFWKKFIFLLATIITLHFAWKHGFVRADGHMAIFISTIPIISCFAITKIDKIPKIQIKSASLLTVILLYLVILPIYTSDKPKINVFHSYENIKTSFFSLINKISILQNPFLHIKNLNQRLYQSKQDMFIPDINTYVGKDTISYYGFLPAKIIYNGLNHIPTPLTISFTGWNNFAIKKNANFFSNKKIQPEYLIEEPGTIDQRFYPCEDSLTKLNILNNFTLTTEYKNFNLLKRITNNLDLNFQKLYEKQFNLGQKIVLSDNREKPTFVKIHIQKNLIERILTIIYKPPEYAISIQDSNNKVFNYRLVVDAAEFGFLVSPIIENIFELSAVRDAKYFKDYQNFHNGPLRSCKSLTITSKALRKFSASKGTIEVFQVHNLSMGCEKTKRVIPFQYFIKNLDISFEQFYQTIQSEGKTFYYLPAPSSFNMDLLEKRFLEIESLMPFTTYSEKNRSDGVLLVIDFKNKNSIIMTAKKDIDPYNNIMDRGIFKTKFQIPSNSTSCTVKVLPKQNSAWDQFYISEINLFQ